MSIRLSMVSHGQSQLANRFLQDLSKTRSIHQLVVTENIADAPLELPPGMHVLSHLNDDPLGFAANHNRALQNAPEEFLCVANPDLRLIQDPFPRLLAAMKDPQIGLIAPLVLSPAGVPEDNARRFPTPWGLGLKLMGLNDGRYHLNPSDRSAPRNVEWVAGMMLLIRARAFQDVGGFDAKFHLYYEDVDICARLWKAGWKVACDPGVTVIHEAQRASRRDPQYMRWHAASMARYFIKHLGRLPAVPEAAHAHPLD